MQLPPEPLYIHRKFPKHSTIVTLTQDGFDCNPQQKLHAQEENLYCLLLFFFMFLIRSFLISNDRMKVSLNTFPFPNRVYSGKLLSRYLTHKSFKDIPLVIGSLALLAAHFFYGIFSRIIRTIIKGGFIICQMQFLLIISN